MTRQPGSSNPTLVLEWGIKRSLVKYISGMHDGSTEVAEPASICEGGFHFPAAVPSAAVPTDEVPLPAAPHTAGSPEGDGILRFAGSVTLTGHSGMLKLAFTDPWLVPGADPGDRWSLTIVDPYEPDTRIAFATIDRLVPGDLGTESVDSRSVGAALHATALGTRLTADGADLFFSGPYAAGTELDNPRILVNA